MINNLYIGDTSYSQPDIVKYWADEYFRMAVHTQKLLPIHLIGKRRPTETPATREYRLENYRAITFDQVNRAIERLQSLLSYRNVQMNISPKLRAKIEEPIFDGNDFSFYMNTNTIQRMVEDANGYLVCWATGEGITDKSKTVDPKPLLVYAYNTVDPYIKNDTLTFISDEKYYTEDGDAKYYRYQVTKDAYYKIWVNKDGDDVKTLYYKHNLGEAPFLVLRGIKTTKQMQERREQGASRYHINRENQDEELYISYFAAFLEYADEIVNQFSDLQAIKVTTNFPMRLMTSVPCKECRGIGSNPDPDTIGKNIPCTACGGEGRVFPASPFGVIAINDDDNALVGESGQTKSSQPALSYVSPDVDIIKNAEEYVEALQVKGDISLSLIFTLEAQSGVAKNIDKDSSQLMVDRIGINYIDNLTIKFLQYIQGLCFIGDNSPIDIIKPSTFSNKTEKQLLDELQVLRDTSAPPFLIQQTVASIVKLKFNGDKIIKRSMEHTMMYDVLFASTPKDISYAEASGALREEDIIRHSYVGIAMNNIINNSDDFLSLTYDEIKVKLDAYIDPIIAETVKANMLYKADGSNS